MRGHAGGDFAQFLEVGDPENLIDQQVAVMALRGVGVGAEKNQLRTVVTEHNRVAGQLNVNPPGKLNDVLAEDIRLRFARGKKNLVVAGFQRVQQ